VSLSSEDFLQCFTTVRSFPDTGFPLPMLRLPDGFGDTCPLVTPAICDAYEARP
jgi:hypothetical protein